MSDQKEKQENGLTSPFSMIRLELCFNKPASAESIFILTTILNSADSDEINDVLDLFVKTVSLRKGKSKPPEIVASWGIYFAIILRYHPDTMLYVNGRHFLIEMFETYNPYIGLFITFFLLLAVIKQTNMESPAYASEDNSKNKEDGPTVIDVLIDMCPRSSVENKTISTLRRMHTTSPNYYIIKLGLKKSKQELAIFLDMSELIEEELTEDDIMKAIYMQSNNVLNQYDNFKPEHFGRSIQCLNLDIALKTHNVSDWIDPDIFDNFIYMCRYLNHAKCFEMLQLCVTRNVILCKHHIKRIPKEWRTRIIEIYTTPRWQSSNSKSTMQYYAANLCSEAEGDELKDLLQNISETIRNKHDFLSQVNTMNKSYFVLQVSGYCDFLSEIQTSFGNKEDLLLNDVFDISRNFVLPFREENGLVFLFTYTSFPTLIEKKQNPYNRNPLPSNFLKQATEIYERYTKSGLGPSCPTMTEFINELLEGRSIEYSCSCTKNYKKKLVRILRHYAVKDESLEWINIPDILIKFRLISITIEGEDLENLCENLYRKIKESPLEFQSEIKETIASLILIYSKSNGGFILSM